MNLDKIRQKYPKKIADLPEGEFYAILRECSVYIEGDERSRTNPGHGYPAHTEEYFNIEVYENQDDWEHEIKKEVLANQNGKYRTQKFQAVKITPVQIHTTVDVKVG